MRRIRPLLLLALSLAWDHAGAADPVKGPQLVHAFAPTGPVEVAGAPVAGKVLRTMQRHAAPAFTDLLAAHVAHALQGASDPPFGVTRRPRQGGNDAVAAVSSAAADGTTVLLSGLASAQYATSSSYETPPAGLRHVALVASMPSVFITGSDSTRAALRDFIRDARTRLLAGSGGGKSAGHIALEMLGSRPGLHIEPVPYNGGIAALHAVAANQVSMALVPLPSVLPYLGAGRVRILAIADRVRHPAIPHVPTTAQADLAGVEATSGYGVLAPSATPQSVIRKLNASLAQGLESGPSTQVFSELGIRLEHRSW